MKNTRLFPNILFLLTCLLSAVILLGQTKQDLIFDNITKKEGLSSDFINDVIKDSLGFIWIATNDGLCRYDGPGQVQRFGNENTTGGDQSDECFIA